MGYTISTHAANKKLQVSMYNFMVKNYKDAQVLFKLGLYSRYSGYMTTKFDLGKNLSYERHSLALGFDYNCCEPERDYIFAITRWMTLKTGNMKSHKGLGEAPTVYYDGGHNADDRWPVLVKGAYKNIPKDWAWCITNKYGFKPMINKYKGTPLYNEADAQGKKEYLKKHSSLMKELCGFSAEEADLIIHKELKRLDRLWNNRCTYCNDTGLSPLLKGHRCIVCEP